MVAWKAGLDLLEQADLEVFGPPVLEVVQVVVGSCPLQVSKGAVLLDVALADVHWVLEGWMGV